MAYDLDRAASSPSLMVQLIHPDARVPTRGHHGDAGYDLAACEAIELQRGARTLVRTGVRFQLPPGYYGQIVARSSSIARGLHIDFSVIDNGWRGEIYVWATAVDGDSRVNVGDRIAQFIVAPIIGLPVELVHTMNLTSQDGRNSNGFGSTGGWEEAEQRA